MTKEHFKELFTQTKQAAVETKVIGRKRIIKANLVAGAPIVAAKESMKSAEQAYIELKKNGDIIEIIKVNCSCGRETQIVLEYDNKQSGVDEDKTDAKLGLSQTGNAIKNIS